jgi:hypothetical protein
MTLYGLKQSPHLWNSDLDKYLKSCSFLPSQYDPCLYSKRENDNSFSYIFVWVDDLLIAAKPAPMSSVIAQLSTLFDLSDTGPLQDYLNLRFTRDRVSKSISISASHYISHILQRFQMTHCIPVSTPMDQHLPLSKEKSNKLAPSVPYRQLVGQLLYLAYTARPDIAAAVGVLCKFSNDPRTDHWTAAKKVLRYLKGTSELKLFLQPNSLQLIGFADANWATDTDSRKSTTGYIFKIGNSPISWNTKLQPTVALSSCEAEYMALATAAQEGIFLSNVLKSLGVPIQSLDMYEDNQGAIELTKSTKNHARTKHIDIRYHFLKDLVKDGFLHLKHIRTHEMEADMFTKALASPQFNKLRDMIGIH